MQRQMIPYLRRMLQGQQALYRKVVTPFVVMFWTRRFAERRIHFRTPDLVEAQLREAVGSQVEDSAQLVLDAMALGLG